LGPAGLDGGAETRAGHRPVPLGAPAFWPAFRIFWRRTGWGTVLGW